MVLRGLSLNAGSEADYCLPPNGTSKACSPQGASDGGPIVAITPHPRRMTGQRALQFLSPHLVWHVVPKADCSPSELPLHSTDRALCGVSVGSQAIRKASLGQREEDGYVRIHPG